MLTPSQKIDLAGFHDGADTHGDGPVGDVLLTVEVLDGIAAGEPVQTHHACARVGPRTWLIEANMPCTPNAQQLYVNAAVEVHQLFIPLAVGLHVFQRLGAVGYVNL